LYFLFQVYRAALEMVCTVSLERRLGFLDQEINLDIQSIMDSLRGYQVRISNNLSLAVLLLILPETEKDVVKTFVRLTFFESLLASNPKKTKIKD
jgi:hypothetical protein